MGDRQAGRLDTQPGFSSVVPLGPSSPPAFTSPNPHHLVLWCPQHWPVGSHSGGLRSPLLNVDSGKWCHPACFSHSCLLSTRTSHLDEKCPPAWGVHGRDTSWDSCRLPASHLGKAGLRYLLLWEQVEGVFKTYLPLGAIESASPLFSWSQVGELTSNAYIICGTSNTCSLGLCTLKS